MIYYKQCKLQKENSFTTTWIPEKYAKIGKYIKLKNNDYIWVDGWMVIKIGEVRLPEQLVNDRSQDYKRQRKASDI